MYRRRGTEDDSTELVQDEDAPSSEDVSEGNFNSLRLKEEKHNVPRPLAVLKLRIAAKTNSPKGKFLCWWVTVALLGFVALIFVLVPLLIERGKRKGCSDFLNNPYGAAREQPELPFFFQRDTGYFEICRGGESVLSGTLGIGRSLSSEVKVNTFRDSSGAMLNITNLPNQEEHCIRIAWTGTSSKLSPLQDCYHFGSEVNWYGAYEQMHQKWPIDFNVSGPFSDIPFLPTDLSANQESSLGSILHPFWLSSIGVGIVVDQGIPLHIRMNSSAMCLSAQPSHLDCGSNLNGRTSLNYTVCAFGTVSDAAKFFLGSSKMIARPNQLPDFILFETPLWTSSVQSDITQYLTNEVMEACDNIISLNLPISQLEIGDEYSLTFQNSLLNSGVTIGMLNHSSCDSMNLSVWVHPFVNYNWNNFEIGLRNDYYLPGQGDVNGNTVSLIRWSEDFGAIINFFNADAKLNYETELNHLKNTTKVSSFNFHGGHYNYLPKCAFIDGLQHSGSFTEAYVSFVANQNYSKRSSVRVGFYTQDKPIFVRLSRNIPHNSSEDLSSLLNAVLSVGLGGYSFIIPEVMAGFESCQNVNSTCFYLYVRWIELSTFLPVLHFSVIPHMFTNTRLIQLLKSLSLLHESLNFTRHAEDAIQTGYPIIRPLWWRGSDQKTLNISDQFYIGDHYMVAPILHASSESRMVYFPAGSNYIPIESDLLPKKTPCPSSGCNGGKYLSFDVTLYEVLFFSIVPLE